MVGRNVFSSRFLILLTFSKKLALLWGGQSLLQLEFIVKHSSLSGQGKWLWNHRNHEAHQLKAQGQPWVLANKIPTSQRNKT